MFTSEKIFPYVYYGVHKETGQFYTGYRGNRKQKLPSHLDLLSYKTSSRKIKEMGFENFDWFIIAEFFDPISKFDDAYQFEQQLIYESWNNPLKLNGRYHLGNKWSTEGISSWNKGRKNIFSKEVCKKISEKNKGKKRTEENKKKLSDAHRGKNYQPHTIITCPFCNKSGGKANMNRYHFDKCSQKLENIKPKVIKQKKKIFPIVKCPHCNKEGAVSGMKRYHFDNCKMKEFKTPSSFCN